MRTRRLLGLVALVVLTFALGPASVSAEPPRRRARVGAVPRLVAGASIGPVRIGMTRAEVDGLGLEVRPHPSGQFGDAVRLVGPYWVVFGQDERVDSIATSLRAHRAGVRVGRRTIPPRASLEEAARLLDGCGPREDAQGGSMIRCAAGRVMVKKGALPDSPVELQVFRVAAPQ